MKKFIYATLSFAPMLALAQATGGADVTGGLTGFGAKVITLINGTIVPILFAFAVVYFLYGLVRFIMAAGDEDKRKEGKSAMLWGIIALLVMVSIYGILGFLATSLGLTGAGSVTLPKVPTS